MTQIFDLKVTEDGIAELCFNLPGEKVNKLTTEAFEELENHLDSLAKNPNIKALKITSGKEDQYIAGADIHMFEHGFKDPALIEPIIRMGHRIFSKLQNLPFPTVAVINGICVGGGLELALSCTYRIVTDHPKTTLGLPEVNLGIFPGWGATQRLPRLIGLTEGLNMILTGKAVNGVKAFKIHLADAIVAWEFLPEKTAEFIKQILSKDGVAKILARRQNKRFLTKMLENNPAGRAIIFKQSKKAVLEKTKEFYPAPLIALDVIKKGYPLPLQEGLKIEMETMLEKLPILAPVARNLMGLFFIQEAAKKETGAPKEIKPLEVKAAAVIGAGTMGAAIGWLLADRNVMARLKDVSWDMLGKGISAVRKLFEKGLKAKKLTPAEFDRRFQLISATVDYSGFQHVQFVIEAATENLELKRKIFHEIEENVPENAIIASNTSSLTIAEMSAGMKHPERFVGMHFFNPVNKMPLVEVVAGPTSTPEAIATTVALSRKMGKTPIVVKDCHGFLVNRIFLLGANESILLLEEGYPMETLDKIILGFGMPMAPFVLADEVGIDVMVKVGKVFEDAYGERMRGAKLPQLMYDKEFYGRKNGKGFYLYKGKKMTVNPAVRGLIKAVGRLKAPLHPEDVQARFAYGMINEAARCLEENVIAKPEYLDLSLIMGIGFPPFRGGLLRYADDVGIASVVETLKRFEKEYGVRFKPCELLERMAKNNETFYKNGPG